MSEILEGNIFTHLSPEPGCATNAKVNKLIKCIESEKSHKSIVLLLVELAENHDLSSDMIISLQYYLDMFEDLKEEPSFPETGMLLLNSAIIYGRRVDNIHFNVEKLLLSLINSETTKSAGFEASQNVNIPLTINGTKKGRKRPLDQLYKTYEIEMNIKRFRALSSNKRFEDGISCIYKKKNNKAKENDIKSSIEGWIKDYTHPQSWLCSSIEDFDYEEEVDLKKNYKLLTYHLEHRYNTLIPDLNFKIYFKMKDYIDAVYNDSTNTEMWPPLSDAYIKRFVNLENRILHIEGACDRYEKGERNDDDQIPKQCQDDINEISINFHSQMDITTTVYLQENDLSKPTEQQNLSKAYKSCNEEPLKAASVILQRSFSSLCHFKSCQTAQFPRKTDDHDDNELQINNLTESSEDLHTIRVLLPHLDDEGVYFSDLDERDQQMLSPAVVATDVFRCIKDKTNIVVIIDDVIKRVYNIQEPKTKLLFLPILSRPEYSSISLNFLKIDHKCFKKRRPFKLGPDFHLLKQERLNKFCHKRYRPNRPRIYVRLCEDVAEVPISPLSSPNYEPDFFGFPEEIFHDKNRTLSRDSGISLQMHENTIDQDLNVDSSKRDCQLQFTQKSSNKTNNINDLNQNEIQFNILAETKDKYILSVSSEDILCNEKYKVADGENNSNISKPNCIMLTENSVTAKVQQWHTYLQPLLLQSKDRHHFDIFKLGTEILNHFEENNKHDKIISFQNVMENRDSSLVSRYFLSTLSLANQGNISINIISPNAEVPTDLNNVGLKLLSKTRSTYSREENSRAISPQVVKEQQKNCFNITCTKIRTLKPVYMTSRKDDHDSGISMSDDCSL